LKLAKLSEYVSELPNGLNTVIGEGGAGLSGGQRQRLGIARALYSQPSLLILDEATSSLDSKTEKLVSESIDELHGEMTVIVIAHRLSTILNADRIIFLEDGKVNGIGNFETLKSRNSTFQKLAQDSGL
jgi:ABC-type multidrug transport system fused ATPase/permease subunit